MEWWSYKKQYGGESHKMEMETETGGVWSFARLEYHIRVVSISLEQVGGSGLSGLSGAEWMLTASRCHIGVSETQRGEKGIGV